MSIYDTYLRDRPFRAWKINTGSTWRDLTGSGATLTANVGASPAIVSGGGSPMYLGNASFQPSQPFPNRFDVGFERKSFTLEVWALITLASTRISFLSHNGQYDGLWFDGDRINFTVNFNTAGNVTASWAVPDFYQTYHVVGVYDRSKIYLYVNGSPVATQDIGEEQFLDGFSTATTGSLYSGQNDTNNLRVHLDGVALYGHALTPEAIQTHYNSGKAPVVKSAIVGNRDGILYRFNDDDRGATMAINLDWASGSYTDVGFSNGTLTPNTDDETEMSMPGVWLGSVPLSSFDTTVQGVKLEWNGDGDYTVQTSVNNGLNWTTAVNGNIVAGTLGVDPAVIVDVDIKVSFQGGDPLDQSVVRDMTATVYSSLVVSGNNATRFVTLSGSVTTSATDSEPIERSRNAGLRTYGGYGTLGADTATDDPQTIAAVELWFRIDSLNSVQYILDARSSNAAILYYDTTGGTMKWAGTSAMYINGFAVADGAAFAPLIGQWTHAYMVLTTAIQVTGNAFVVAANNAGANPVIGQIGMMATYQTALTAAQIAEAYKSYSAPPITTSVDTVAVVAIAETANPYTLYKYDWSIQPTL